MAPDVFHDWVVDSLWAGQEELGDVGADGGDCGDGDRHHAASVVSGENYFGAPRCFVWVDSGGQPPQPPGILRFGACRQVVGAGAA